MSRFTRLVCIASLLLIAASLHAQQVTVRGGFLADSIKIGGQIPYYLTATYPSRLTVLFPDSSYAFKPFEYTSKYFVPTVTRGDVSYDSVVYYLTTFEIDAAQPLQLPVFVAATRDCTAYTPAWDTVYLQELVKTPPPDTLPAQNLPLKSNTAYEQVFYAFNYPVLLIIAGVTLVVLVVCWLLFGKKIRRHFRVKRLTREYQRFRELFEANRAALTTSFSARQAEATVLLWKKYLEQLEQKPFTKMTSRELAAAERNDELGNYLRSLDRAIYGHATAVSEPLIKLQEDAEQRFTKKLEEVSHG